MPFDLNVFKSKQVTLSAGFIGIAILASASIFATGPAATPAERKERAWPVSVTEIVPARLQPSFSAFGRLESNRVAKLRSDLVAAITRVHVQEGDWVEAGQLLIELDRREADLRLLERDAELKRQQAILRSMQTELELARETAELYRSRHEVAQAKLQRHRDLMNERLIAKSLLDEVTSSANTASIEFRNQERVLLDLPNQIAASEASVARARALFEQARLDVDKASIHAPFSGPVLAVHAAPGDYNNLSTPLVELAANDGYEVRVQVPDAYADQFGSELQSDPGSITALADSGTSLRLVRLARHVKSGQTGLDAFFAFDNPANAPELGRVFNLTISMPPGDELVALPVQSIYENDRVYAVRDNRLVAHPIVRIGERETEAGYEVLISAEGLAAGDRVITTQLPKAVTGLLVEVANDLDGSTGS